MTESTRDDDELAAEYVVGLLPEEIRADVAKRIERDQNFAAIVTGWQNRLADFNQAYGNVKPPARIKRAIDAHLFAAPPPRRGTIGSWIRGMLSGGAVVAALVLAALWFGIPGGGDDFELVARLETVEQGFVFEAAYDADTNQLTITPVSGSLPAGRALELWAILPDSAPISLGVIAGDKPTNALPAVTMAKGVTLAVSLEPPGGSPTGAPTGPVLSAGVLEDA